ncbi:MAG: co-chaperone GroES [Opitutae bacterium]
MKDIKPLGDRILVKILEEEEQVRDGIIIPDSAKEKSQEAEIIALGSGKKDSDGNRQEFDVNVGDKVLISKYGGTEVKLDGASHQLLREDDILGIIS